MKRLIEKYLVSFMALLTIVAVFISMTGQLVSCSVVDITQSLSECADGSSIPKIYTWASVVLLSTSIGVGAYIALGMKDIRTHKTAGE
jgi:hypothetical protein